MSVPLIFMMINSHATVVASPIAIVAVVLIGWGAVYWLYQTSKTVQGF
jgi:hypothetical protein